MISLTRKAPHFRLHGVQSQQVNTFGLQDFRGKWLILFFYPEDFSFICPTEVKGFHELYPQFTALGAQVVGISVDDPDMHKKWMAELGGIAYPLLSDTKGEVARAYQAYDEDTKRARRATFIIDPEGAIQFAMMTPINVGRSVEETLRVLQALLTGKPCPVGWRPSR